MTFHQRAMSDEPRGDRLKRERHEAMATAIHDYLRRRSGVTMVEIERDVPGVKGNNIWGSIETNTVIWKDMSEEAIAAMVLLIRDGKVIATPTSPLVYAYDGGILSMPTAASLKKKYARPHWLPTVFAGNREAA